MVKATIAKILTMAAKPFMDRRHITVLRSGLGSESASAEDGIGTITDNSGMNGVYGNTNSRLICT